jgi:hypothetical protein
MHWQFIIYLAFLYSSRLSTFSYSAILRHAFLRLHFAIYHTFLVVITARNRTCQGAGGSIALLVLGWFSASARM